MRVLFSLGHPAHYHLFKHAMAELRERGHGVKVTIKTKDVLEQLLQADGWEYDNILPRIRRNNAVSMAWSQIVRDVRLYKIAREYRPDIMLGTSVEIAHIGRLLGIPSIVLEEDDTPVIPLFAWLAYPFANHILAPTSCEMGRWEHKTLRYDGLHELAYLHPRRFEPDPSVRSLLTGDSPYSIIRFAQLTAHHDSGIRGLHPSVVSRLIEILSKHGAVYITSERPLEPEFEPYRIGIAPEHMHHALYYAMMYIGDSQTMAAEAAVLGTPAIRVNDFVGRLGYLEELEHRFALTYGIVPDNDGAIIDKVEELLALPDLKAEWDRRRKTMLSEMVDTTDVILECILDYPDVVNRFRNGEFLRR